MTGMRGELARTADMVRERIRRGLETQPAAL